MTARRLSGLAMGLLLSVPTVQAQTSVQLFGVIDAYVGRKQLANVAGTKTNNVDAGGLTTSHWGFRGTEDLGEGLAAIFEVSGFIRNDVGDTGRFPGDPVFSRTSMVGLRGGWGEVRLGRLSTLNFVSSVRLNPFAESTSFAPILLHTYTGGQPLEGAINSGGATGVSDTAFSNAIAYTTPNLGGVTGSLMYSLGELAGGGNNRLGYSLIYQAGPLLASLSGERVDRPTLAPPPTVAAGNQKKEQATDQLGVAYDFGFARLFAQHSRTRIELPLSAVRKFQTSQLGTTVPLGVGRVMLSAASTKRTETALAGVRRTTWSLGYDYELSKRTDVYTVVMHDSVTNLRDGRTYVAGVRHRF